MDEESNKKGFSGLSSLASKMEDHASSAGKKLEPKAEPPPSSKPDNKPASPSTPSPVAASKQQSEKPSSGTSDSSSGWKWLVGIVAVIAVVAIYNKQSHKAPSTTSSFTPPSSSYETNAVSPPVLKPVTPPPLKVKPKVEPKIEPKITFEMPQVGRDNILSVAQIRWCQREDIRLGAKKPLIKNNIQVSEFNISVDDYNQRCGSFRYRPGSLERAKREVEKLRIEIEKAARAEFEPEIKQVTKPPVKGTAPLQQKPASNTAQTKFSSRDVREVQMLLTELGYQPGPVDGSYGLRTGSAVKDFQRNFGIAQDGLIDKNLLSALKIAAKKKSDAISNSALSQSTVSPVNTSEQLKIEKHCSLLTSTPGDRYNCIQRELKKLKQSEGKPDLSRIAPDEKVQIEQHCSLLTSTPGDEYNCIRRELNNLLQSKGKPDLSRIAPDEKMQIEKHCSLLTSTPGDKYNCIRRELTKLRQSGGKPDLSRIPSNDRAQIENHCSLLTSTPGDEYNCIRRELRKVN